jgi:para-nitrobenzyl esterase
MFSFEANWRAIRVLAAIISFVILVPVARAQTIVTTESGKIEGTESDGVIAFRGVPFALPPVGELRWRPPQSVKKWEGIRPAKEYGHDCMQLPFPTDAAPLGTPPSEDCLYANIWMPARHDSKPLAVMVWIYGGGSVNGGSSPAVYDGSQFARDGIVFVSFNYRVGRFGFFFHPALAKEAKGRMYGNYAYMDELAALKWVQRNIHAFGGDPCNVTIFGESFGGGSVQVLLISPLARGLFQRAIIESGGGRNKFGHIDEDANNKPAAAETALAFAKANGIEGNDEETLRKLRALSADQVTNGLNMATSKAQAKTFVASALDGKIIVSNFVQAYEANMQAHVPLMVGANNYELGGEKEVFGVSANRPNLEHETLAPFGDKADQARKIYDPNHSGDWANLAVVIGSDRANVEPARFVASVWDKYHVPVWEYRFSYVAASMRGTWDGAVHASEIPYAFDTVAARYGSDLTPPDESVARTMHAYWVAFVKTGKPEPEGLPKWLPYHASADVLMNFTGNGPVSEADPWKARLDLTEAVQK